ncbi:MAG: DUF1214 domain-containing protein [Acidimicrobiales bacterium]
MLDEAWRRLSENIAELGRVLPDPPFPQNERDSTDGYRYLTRLMVIGLQWAVEFADPDFPAFYRHDDDVTKWGGPNVDNTYLRARVRGDNSYRIVGRCGTSHGFLISALQGDMQLEEYGVYDEIWDDQLVADDDGAFELLVSAERPPRHEGNWLRLHPDTGNITVRAYYNDWSSDTPPAMRIERIGGEGLSPPPLTPAEMARRIDEASDWIVKSFHYWNRYVDTAHRKVGANVLIAPGAAQGGAKDIAYGFGFFRLDDDEAYVIEGAPPDAWFWNIMLYNLGWMESLDFANRVTSLNGHQMQIDDDGRYRVVIAHRDPGVSNWLDTTGLREGMIATRYIRTADVPPQTGQLVKFDKLRDALSPTVPAMSVDQRRAQIAIRQAHVATRFRH